jgi:hypothetical protein
MKKLILTVPPDLHKALLAHKEATGVPITEFLRRVISRALWPAPIEPNAPVVEKRATQPALLLSRRENA